MEVSLRTVASESGYSLCTVSKALRDDPKISQATREKVKALADRLGYRPNAALSRVSSRKTGRGSGKILEPLAFVHGMAPDLRRPPRMSEVAIAAAKERAQALGYALEVYDYEKAGSAQMLDRILYARGVRGILVGALMGPFPEGLPLKWDRYCGVWISQRWLPLALPVIRTSYLTGIRNCVAAIEQRGYRRLGTLIWRDPQHEFQNFAQVAATTAYRELPRQKMRVLRPLVMPKKEWSEPRVRAYLEAEQPDALLIPDYSVYLKLQQMRLRFPQDLGVAMIHLPQQETDDAGRTLAGINSVNEAIGREAVDLVDAAIRHGNYGLGYDREIVLPSSFKEGDSLPTASSSAGSRNR